MVFDGCVDAWGVIGAVSEAGYVGVSGRDVGVPFGQQRITCLLSLGRNERVAAVGLVRAPICASRACR